MKATNLKLAQKTATKHVSLLSEISEVAEREGKTEYCAIQIQNTDD